MAIRALIPIFVVVAAAAACQSDPTIAPANQIPIADARVIRNGQSINARTDGEGGAAGLMFDFSGAPVAVTLDGTHSYDPDGTIVAYRWRSATLAPEGGTPLPDDAGVMLRLVPPGAGPDWPGNVAQPQVELGEGIWSFALWVVDNGGATSQPDTIKITVGTVVDPAVTQCASNVLPTEPAACRQCLCSQSDKCRAAVTMDACDQTCWNLINCVSTNCPDFQAMAAKGDYSCLTTNCAAYTSGSTGATPATPCFTACPSDCMGVPIGGSDAGGSVSEGGGAGDGSADSSDGR